MFLIICIKTGAKVLLGNMSPVEYHESLEIIL